MTGESQVDRQSTCDTFLENLWTSSTWDMDKQLPTHHGAKVYSLSFIINMFGVCHCIVLLVAMIHVVVSTILQSKIVHLSTCVKYNKWWLPATFCMCLQIHKVLPWANVPWSNYGWWSIPRKPGMDQVLTIQPWHLSLLQVQMSPDLLEHGMTWRASSICSPCSCCILNWRPGFSPRSFMRT